MLMLLLFTQSNPFRSPVCPGASGYNVEAFFLISHVLAFGYVCGVRVLCCFGCDWVEPSLPEREERKVA
jgi:hypothetical protein